MKAVISRPDLVEPRIGAVVLAAGASARFGERDKLLEPFRGQPLGHHVVESIPVHRLLADCAYVVAANADHPCMPVWQQAGFNVALNENAKLGMATSVAIAGQLALKAGCDAVVIALADMPCVPTQHFEALMNAYHGPSDILCSSNELSRMPPALIGKDHFAKLISATGDQGARELLKQARIVSCPPEWLFDIDTPQDAQRYGQVKGHITTSGSNGEE